MEVARKTWLEQLVPFLADITRLLKNVRSVRIVERQKERLRGFCSQISRRRIWWSACFIRESKSGKELRTPSSRSTKCKITYTWIKKPAVVRDGSHWVQKNSNGASRWIVWPFRQWEKSVLPTLTKGSSSGEKTRSPTGVWLAAVNGCYRYSCILALTSLSRKSPKEACTLFGQHSHITWLWSF